MRDVSATRRPIEKLLVANRGEIARRVFRTCRAMGVATVAVYSDPDANAPFVAEADEAFALGGSTPAESYLRGDAVVEAALRTGADAVHPGYGFLSENAGFARACAEAGLAFVGPSPEAIEAMGSKLAAKALMEKAGVPVLPGAEMTGMDATSLAAAAEAVGYPVLVKASFGGGGRGMRVVREPAALAEAVASAQREAGAAFGDDTVFLERYVDEPRHVEIQIFGDSTGRVVSLFERDCSIQRRHQKVVEESPSPAVDDTLRAKMSAAAVAAGEAIGYEGAGTVEFLLAPGGEFFFLEVNTRLQVEHPVTEMVTGLDLVRLQLLVTAGEPLPPEALSPEIAGHAIEVRLYAEDPERDFLPVTGTLHRFAYRPAPGLRVDTGVEEGSVVSPYYDPMLAKVIAHAPTRAEAARVLSAALAGMRLHGPTTNRDFLVRLLRHPEFLSGATDTHFLERHSPAALGAPLAGPEGERLHVAAAAFAAAAEHRAGAPVLASIPSGWRNNPSAPQEAAFEGRSGRIEVRYRLGRDGLGLAELSVDDEEVPARLLAAAPDRVDLVADGVRRRYDVQRVGDAVYVDSALGASALRRLERLPEPVEAVQAGSLLAPMPGTVVRVAVAAGDEVAAGDVLVVVEAMKMEHRVAAPAAGWVTEVRVAPGQQVDTGAVLVVVQVAQEPGQEEGP